MQAITFQKHLEENLIPFWNRMQDTTYGGFYGGADETGVPEKKIEKGSILGSRILWFYSTAYALLKQPELLASANKAYQFLADFCFDSRYGGVYWSVQYDGKPADDAKHTYAQAFAVYALSAYYHASGCKSALRMAYALYRTIEEKCSDADGYLEAFQRDFSPTENEKLSENGVLAERTMNTLLHILEAYTELYRADRFYEVGDSIRRILQLFQKKLYVKDKQICTVFLDKNYHSLLALESYGHDIEASWLVDRACQVLQDAAYQEELQPLIDGLAEGAYRHGMDLTVHALNDESENGTVDRQKIWWVQAEAVTGFYNAYQRHPERTEYAKASEEIWDYIRANLIDSQSGEWLESIPASGKAKPQKLAHAWKCPYHNGRMCMEMMQRLSEAERRNDDASSC